MHWIHQTCSRMTAIPGSKINFFRQAPIGDWNFFFSDARWKIWSPKSVNKIFPSQRNTNGWKVLVANFSFKIQNKENAFGATMAIFLLTNKIKYKHAENFHTCYWKTTTNESNAGHIRNFVQLPNVLSQLYTFSCLYLLEKKCTLLKSCHLIPHATICMLWETTEKTWLRSFALIIAVKHCGRFAITGKSVLYSKNSGKVKK